MSDLQENPGIFVEGPKHEYYKEYGGNEVWATDPDTGARDLIYDPNDPTQIAPYGCLLNAADSIPGRRDLVAKVWSDPDVPGIMKGATLPDHFVMGPKELGGGLGLDVVGTCLQKIGDCTCACASNVVEGTMNSEDILFGQSLYHPQISISHLYYGAQAAFGKPGGDGAMTQGVAMVLQGYKQTKYANSNGRYGGVVHEAPCDAVTDPNLASGYPYQPQLETKGVAPPAKWIEFGLKHLCGEGTGDCRAVADFDSALQVWASGHIIFTGITWPQSWSYCDKNGFLTKQLSFGAKPGGHEVNFCGYVTRKAQSGYGGSNTLTMSLAGGSPYWLDMGNSWGLDFGVKGHILVPYAQFQQVGAMREMYTISYCNGWDKSRLLDWAKAYN